jgi:hypothetical protein
MKGLALISIRDSKRDYDYIEKLSCSMHLAVWLNDKCLWLKWMMIGLERIFMLSVAVCREAARECRRKKKDYIKCLENRVALLENQNKTLIEELKSLKELYCQKEVQQ